MNNQNNKKKTFQVKFLISISVLLLLVISIFTFIFWEQSKPDAASAAIIRNAVAIQLGKDPIEFTDADFAAIRKLDLSGKEVYDISLLEKFTNLEELNLGNIPLPKPKVPKWMLILKKAHINLSKRHFQSYKERYFIDLGPLVKLTNLKTLSIPHTAFKDIRPLTQIENLQKLVITDDFFQYDEYESVREQLPELTLMIDSTEGIQIEARIKYEFENY